MAENEKIHVSKLIADQEEVYAATLARSYVVAKSDRYIQREFLAEKVKEIGINLTHFSPSELMDNGQVKQTLTKLLTNRHGQDERVLELGSDLGQIILDDLQDLVDGVK